MKNSAIAFLVLLFSMTAQAVSIESSEVSISPASIDQVIRLSETNPGSTLRKVSLTVQDFGLSTDVSPRYALYLSYASLAEMGNIYVNFKLADDVYKFTSAVRTAPGMYEIKYQGLTDEGTLQNVVLNLDTTPMYVEENKQRKLCDGFCDMELKTSISAKFTKKAL